MSYFDKEKNPYSIDKEAHYFALMHPYSMVIPFMGIGLADGNTTDWVECVVTEERYKVDEGYKVTLRPLNPNFASRDFYQCDFQSLMEGGFIVKRDSPDMHIEQVICAEQITPLAYIIHSGNYITK